MGETPQHIETLEGIGRGCIPGLVQVLREEGLEAVRYFLWDITGWHHDYDPFLWKNRATGEHKRIEWEMCVRTDKIMCTDLRQAQERQIEETMDTLSDGPEDSTSAT